MTPRNEDFAKKIWLISWTEAIILHDCTKSLLGGQKRVSKPEKQYLRRRMENVEEMRV
jgi:hypothetical protein